MATQRLEVRLDAEHRRRLERLAADRGEPISEVVRQLIDDAYQKAERQYLHRLIDEMANANLEDVPDPEELSRQLDRTYEPGGID